MWQQRLTSAKEEERARGRANIEHCLRVSHAAGGCGVLIVVGQASDGPADVIEQRCRQEIRKALLKKEGRLYLEAKALSALPPALARRAVRNYLPASGEI
jgi:hypothetical protein